MLTHGAGGNCRSALLTAVADTFARAGTLVLRCDLPFRQRKAFGPPSPASNALDREGLREAVEALRSQTERVFLGGHSYGGRQASILAAEDGTIVSGLLLLSYPLHPPRKPMEMRTAHFPRIFTPTLFVHGANDPFGNIEELRSATSLIPGRVRIVAVERAGHDLQQGRFDAGVCVLQPFRGITE